VAVSRVDKIEIDLAAGRVCCSLLVEVLVGLVGTNVGRTGRLGALPGVGER
jgi:hypothetical protein